MLDYQGLFLAVWLIITLGGLGAAFYFARRDWSGYALISLLVAAATFLVAAISANDLKSSRMPQRGNEQGRAP